MTNDTTSMWGLERDLLAQLDDDRAEILAERYPEDRLHEYADGMVPVYTYTLMQLAATDTGLATDEPDCGPAFDGSPTPVNIIAANVYERLSNAAHAWLREAQQADEEAGA